MMAEKFKNKYRIPSARLQNWDYGSNGAYFITICTQNREHFFGEILNNSMQLNEIGQWAEKFWLEIPNRFPVIALGDFVVMPNHIHGILMINKTNTVGDGTPPPQSPPQTKKKGGVSGMKNPMFYENISRTIRWYKGRCSFEMRKIHAGFGWQARFHDHIIRDETSFLRISNYIRQNPTKWAEDEFFANI
jgi:putative transposase